MPPITDDETLRRLLTTARTIAVVGHSPHPERTSYRVAQQLRLWGYAIYPVNPTVTRIGEEPCYPSLEALPGPADIVAVFRRSVHLPGVVREAIRCRAGAVWGQLDVTHPEAIRLADAAGMPLVVDRCIKIERLRLVRR